MKIVIIFLLSINILFAKDIFIVGAAYQFKPSHYKTEGNRNIYFPIIVYENFYLLGLELGVNFYEKNGFKLNTSINYNTIPGFDNDNLDGIYHFLNSRDPQLEFGVDGSYQTDILRLDFLIKWDISNISNGTNLGLKISKQFRPFIFLFIIPSTQVIYSDSNYANYYYGVSNDEAIKTGLKKEKIEGFITTYLTAEFRVFLSEHFGFFLKNQLEILNLDAQILESDKNYIFELDMIILF